MGVMSETYQRTDETTGETTFLRSSQPLPNVCVATLTSTDGGEAYAMCSVPGGTPRFSLGDPNTPGVVPERITGAPTCDTLADFHAFMVDRFMSEAGR